MGQRDFTDRKEAQERLRQSEERFRATFEQAAVGIAHVAPNGRWLRVNQKLCEIVGYTHEELLEKTFQDITHPDDLDKDLQQARRLLAGEIETYSMEKRYLKKDGSVVWINLTSSLVRDSSGEPEYFIAVIEDISERKEAEENLAARTHQQSAIAELGVRALAEANLSALMNEAVVLVARTLEVEYCKVLQLLPDGEELLLRAGVGWREGLVGTATVRASMNSQAGYTLLSSEPVIVENLPGEERFSGPTLLHEHDVVSGMSAIIQGRDRPFGVLGAHTKSRRVFTEDDINFLQAVANVLATTIERQEAEEKLSEVREEERSRLARDLHDEALQDLTYALAETQLVQARLEDPKLDHQLGRAVEALKRVGQGLRGAIYDLRLERERERPFVESLKSLVKLNRGMAPDCDISLEVIDGLPSAPLGEKDSQLLRIVREALVNARRHSGAHSIRIAIGTSESKLWVELEDDGRGFDPVEVPPGMGIKGMRERARVLGGDLKIKSELGKGTKVRLEVPLEEDREKPQEEEVRILLVEDHASFREAVASLFERELGFTVVGQAGSLAEARKILDGIDVAIIDLGLPDGYGGELIKELRKTNPQAQALVLSATLDQAEIARAVENGAAGVLHKSAGMEEVVDAVRRLRAGESLLPLEEVVELLRFAGSRREWEYEVYQTITQLTPREKEVLQALAEGLDSKEIAERLHISPETERSHMQSILTKLGVHSRLQALVFALRHRVVEIR
jgi:PAS domain S-box-containing protein